MISQRGIRMRPLVLCSWECCVSMACAAGHVCTIKYTHAQTVHVYTEKVHLCTLMVSPRARTRGSASLPAAATPRSGCPIHHHAFSLARSCPVRSPLFPRPPPPPPQHPCPRTPPSWGSLDAPEHGGGDSAGGTRSGSAGTRHGLGWLRSPGTLRSQPSGDPWAMSATSLCWP